MVDPQDVTKFDRTDSQLQEFILFCVSVAGKTARIIAQKLEDFLALERMASTPFDKIINMIWCHSLGLNLQHAKLGRYSVLSKCFAKLAKSGINLRTCSVEELETFPGIGPKTARYFVLHSRPNQRIAVLDTHVLAHLKNLGHSVPRTTPTGKKYAEIEKIFIDYADSLGEDIASLDLKIWNSSSKRSGSEFANEQCEECDD